MITQNFWKLLYHLLTEETEPYNATNAILNTQALLPSFIDKTPAPLERKIFELLYSHVERHQVAPSRTIFFDHISAGAITPDEQTDLQDFITRMQTRSIPRFALEDTTQLLEDYEHGRDIYLFQRTVETAFQIYSQPTKVDGKERHGFEDCLDYTQRHLATLGSSSSKISGHQLAADGEDLYAYYLWEKEQAESMTRSQTGLKHIDSITNGFRLGEMVTLMGYTGDGKCLNADTLILGRGLEQIGSLWPAHTPLVANTSFEFPEPLKVPTEAGFDLATHIYYGGESETVKITLSNGMTLEGTPEHPLRVLGTPTLTQGFYQWARMDALQEGSLVCLAKQALPCISHTKLPEHSFLNFPKEMTPDLALWLGLVVGDGCYTNTQNGVSFVQHSRDSEITDKLCSLTSSLFNLEWKFGLLRLSLSSKNLMSFLESIDLICPDENHDKYIPSTVLKAGPECWKAFLAGILATDGHIQSNSGNGNNIEICMKPERLVREMQQMFQAMGVYSTLHKKVVKAKPGNGRETYWRLILSKASDLPSFFEICPLHRKLSSISQATLNHKGVCHTRVGDFRTLKLAMLAERARLGFKRSTKNVLNPKAGQYGHDVAIRLFDQLRSEGLEPNPELEFIYTNVIPVSVVKIERSRSHVFDLQVPKTHTFIANSIVSHNTSLCINWAYQAFLQRRHVVYYSLEMPADEVLKRFHIRHAANRKFFSKTPVPSSAYLDCKLTDLQADFLFREVIPSFSDSTKFGSIRVREPLDSDLTYEAFKADLLMANAEHPADMFILDYPNLMDVSRDRMDYDKAMSRLYVKLKALCRTFNNGQRITGIIPTQVNKAGREAAEKNNGEYSLRAINQYSEIPNSSDFVFYIYRDKTTNEASECLIGGLKARRCAVPQVARCSFLPELGLVSNLASESEPSSGGMSASIDGSQGTLDYKL